MSRNNLSTIGKREAHAHVFAALGDQTRLLLIAKLSNGEPHSIARLTEGSALSRQAITTHLRVLEKAAIVHSSRRGRESRFEFDPAPIEGIKRYLDDISAQWDEALSRLKSFVEQCGAQCRLDKPARLAVTEGARKPRALQGGEG